MFSIYLQLSTAKSELGWGLIGYIEADPDLDKELHSLDIDELRAYEKRMMQHSRCDHGVISLVLIFPSQRVVGRQEHAGQICHS